MIGSNRGWMTTAYVSVPASFEAVAAAAPRPRPGVAIVPGVSLLKGGRADVMRGEEVQLLGAVHAGLAPPDAMLCQPGTHCKWAWMADGAIGNFVTAMTGEMFAMLKLNALIGREMIGEVNDDEAFAAGVEEAGRGDLLASLFAVRPASLLGVRRPAEAASYVSGLLIGADVRAHVQPGQDVFLLADAHLGGLYARAMAAVGGVAHRIDSAAAFVAGATRLQELIA
jgi:2-dehydro-3-deoxygalactonokinase